MTPEAARTQGADAPIRIEGPPLWLIALPAGICGALGLFALWTGVFVLAGHPDPSSLLVRVITIGLGLVGLGVVLFVRAEAEDVEIDERGVLLDTRRRFRDNSYTFVPADEVDAVEFAVRPRSDEVRDRHVSTLVLRDGGRVSLGGSRERRPEALKLPMAVAQRLGCEFRDLARRT